MNPEEKYGYFTFKNDDPCDTCQQVSNTLKTDLMHLIEYAFDNQDTTLIYNDIRRATPMRWELKLDDIVKTVPGWSEQKFSPSSKEELKGLCRSVWRQFKQRNEKRLLDPAQEGKYVMLLNVMKVDPDAPAQEFHKDLAFGEIEWFYEVVFPLTNYPGQGGTNFASSNDSNPHFPKQSEAYYWNGHVEHQGAANRSGKIRYAFNIEMIAVTDTLQMSTYQLNRYGWKCADFSTVYVARKSGHGEIREEPSGGASAARPKTSSGASGGGASAAPRQTASGGASVKVDRPKTAPASIRDEVAASKAAAKERAMRYYAKQNREEVASGGVAASAPPEESAAGAVDGGMKVSNHPYRLFTYTKDNPSDTCKEITQTMKKNIQVVRKYAFANLRTNEDIKSDILYVFPDDDTDIQEAFPDQDRCELKLDDFLRPEPTWSLHFTQEERNIIRKQLTTVCRDIYVTLGRAKLLDEENLQKYVTIFNIIKVPDGSDAQPWHTDFKAEGAKRTHLYQAIFPLTDYLDQGGTNFNETGAPDFPPKGRGYFFDGFTGHQGTANTSGRTRYALNAETFCVVEGVLFNDYQEGRYGLRCYDLATVHTLPKTSSGAAGGGASAVPDKMSAGGASAAPRPKSSGGASAAPHPKSSGGASAAPHPKSSGGIQDEIASRQAAEERRRNRYEEKQKQLVGSGGGAAPPMPEVIVVSDDDDKGGGLGACIQLLHLRLLALESKHF